MSSKSTPKPFYNQSEFEAYRKLLDDKFTHVPIVREILADLDTPVSTYLKLANQPYTYLFESVQGGDEWGRYSIIGLACETIYRFDDLIFTKQVNGEIISQSEVDNPLDTIRELQSGFHVVDYAGLPEMIGGLVGYFAYETSGFIESRLKNIQKAKLDKQDTADILLMVSKDVLVFDNVSGRIYLVTLAELKDKNTYPKAQQRLSVVISKLHESITRNPMSNAEKLKKVNYRQHFKQAGFEAAVERCKEYIRDGDIMQVVLSQRLSTEFTGQSFDVYRALRTINPSPYMYYLNFGDAEIVGSSPEILVRLSGETVTVRPIAGTRKRGETTQQDNALEKELLSDQKELAEHLMLIDLGRNDVGRIAEIGTVNVTEQMGVERYSHVMHIVSNVEGTIRQNCDAIDVLKATFPAGTVSGAPKIRAMEIIAELEPSKRGIYSGAVGYIGWNGNLDTAIAIRTAVIKDGVLSIQAGAGIVADSVPEYEWQETMSKASAMFSAVEMALAGLELAEQASITERGD